MRDLIRITVRLFGPAADDVGAAELEYGLVPPATLAVLIGLLRAKYPALAEHADAVRFTVNEEDATAGAELATGDVVAVIPTAADDVRLDVPV